MASKLFSITAGPRFRQADPRDSEGAPGHSRPPMWALAPARMTGCQGGTQDASDAAQLEKVSSCAAGPITAGHKMRAGSTIVKPSYIEIDGSQGEGGGQILRSSLALSLCTGKPFRLTRLRAKRQKPGLLRQHLTAVNAAAEIGSARVEGNLLGSAELTFEPGPVAGGSYRFAVGTAGSATLVLQSVLPALMRADAPSELTLEGGTHNPFAPPFDFLDRAFLPLINRLGPKVEAELVRPGFFPAGGGKFVVRVEPATAFEHLELMERGEIVTRRAVARVSNLRRQIAQRELDAVGEMLSWDKGALHCEQVDGGIGPGNVLTLELVSEHVTEIFTGFGQRNVTAERVARGAVNELRAHLASGAPVGPYLADQLLVPLALGAGGRFRTGSPTSHTLTNIEIVKAFLDVEVDVHRQEGGPWTLEVRGGEQ